jgi:biotin transport system substrate-specific component
MLVYMVAGMAGTPWFAGHASGFSMPSFGYVIGFVLAAGLVGAVASRGGDRRPLATIGTMLLGNAVVYAVGVPYLMWSLHVGAATGWDLGMKNYLVGDVLKMLLAAGCLPLAWRLVDRVKRG